MTPQERAARLARARKLIGRVVVATVLLYALLGGVLVYHAYAQQTLSSIYPTPGRFVDVKVPTGNDDVAVKAFYDYNALRHLDSMQEQYTFNWTYFNTMYLAIGTTLIVLYFLMFAWYAKVRGQGDLYPVEVYNAYITERAGPVDNFNWATYAILLTYIVYYTVVNLSWGQYY